MVEVCLCLWLQSLLDDGSQALRATLDEMTTHMLSLHGLVHCLSEVVRCQACARMHSTCACRTRTPSFTHNNQHYHNIPIRIHKLVL